MPGESREADPAAQLRPAWSMGALARIRIANFLALIVAVVVITWSFRGAGVDFGTLAGAEGRRNMARFILGLFPPDVSVRFLSSLATPALETIQMSLAGLALGAVIALPLSFFATRVLSSSQTAGAGWGSRWLLGHVPYLGARAALDSMRSVPELVWALVFIAAVGLGPFAGVLALAVHSAGLLGKLYSENMESVGPKAIEAVRSTGANRLQVAAYAVIPQARPHFVSITLYQWECNIRTATILGFVGAGGIGQSIDLAMRLFRYNELITLMAVVFGLVFAVDGLSALVRRAMAVRH